MVLTIANSRIRRNNASACTMRREGGKLTISIPNTNSHSARYRPCILGAHWSQCSLNGAEINLVVGSRILICLENGEIDKAQVWHDGTSLGGRVRINFRLLLGTGGCDVFDWLKDMESLRRGLSPFPFSVYDSPLLLLTHPSVTASYSLHH